MKAYPWAWAYLAPFFLIATFSVLNLFIAIIVSTKQSMVNKQKEQGTGGIGALVHGENLELDGALRALRAEIATGHSALERVH